MRAATATRIFAALLCLGGVLALTACGAKSAANLGQSVAKAAEKTTGQGSEHVTYSGSVSVAGQSLEMSGQGDFQNSPRAGSMTMTMSGGSLNTSIDAVMQGSKIYVKSPLFASALSGGKTWVSVDLKKESQKLGIDFSQFSQESPASVLPALEKVGSVKKVGTDTIGGVQTTHYRADIDVSKVPNGAAIAKASHLSSVPVDVWVGADGLLRQVEEHISTTVAGQSSTVSTTMRLSNFGEQVNVTPPSPDETVDVTKLGG